jgi:hypothetical protein
LALFYNNHTKQFGGIIMIKNDFIEEYNAIFERSLIFSIISRSMGFLTLENILDKEKCSQRDILEYGMKLVLNGRPSEFIDKLLTNIINLETDKEKRKLKTFCPFVRQSMSRKGNCWDNACAGSFFKTVKCELDILSGKHTKRRLRQGYLNTSKFITTDTVDIRLSDMLHR